jgi:glucose/arabinose dehydrogenase
MRRWHVILAAALVAAAAGTATATLARGGGSATKVPGPSPETRPVATVAGAAPAGSTTNGASAAVSAPPAIALQKVAGTYTRPVYVAAPPGDTTRLFIVEQGGVIRIVKNGIPLPQPFLDLSGQITSGGERGLLSMAFSPQFATSGHLYVDYTDLNGNTRIVRYAVSASNPDLVDPSSGHGLLTVHQPYANHNGGQLQFGPDGRLYVGMGDGGSAGDPQNRAQNSSSRLGKMLRLTLSTSPPKVGVYAKGLRNPWRFSFDRSTGALWIGDVGQSHWEEVDYLAAGRPAGANLGWSAYEGTHVYKANLAAALNKSALVWPVTQYSHSVGYAVTGGYVYRGSAIPALRGYYVFGDYGTGRVWAMKGPHGTRVRLPGADGAAGHIPSFGQDAAGELYIASFNGSVYKIVPGP